MDAVMLAIRPKWCELIANGKKTIEVRKHRPKLATPFKCYIYCTLDKEHTLFKDWIDPPFVTEEYNIMNGKGRKNVFADKRPWGNANGKVIGEFVCDKIFTFGFSPYNHGEYVSHEAELNILDAACLTFDAMYSYIGEKYGFGWHIAALQIYEKPRELSEFSRVATHEKLTRPPMSWCYCEQVQEKEARTDED